MRSERPAVAFRNRSREAGGKIANSLCGARTEQLFIKRSVFERHGRTARDLAGCNTSPGARRSAQEASAWLRAAELRRRSGRACAQPGAPAVSSG